MTAVLATSAVLLGVSVYLAAFHLPLRSDFSNLLPADAPSVKAAEKLGDRVPARDTMLVLVVAPSPGLREAAAKQTIDGIKQIDPDLVHDIETGNDATRDFVLSHRQLYIPTSDLQQVKDALDKQIADAKLHANPLFIELDDPQPAADTKQLDDLRAKQRDAEAKLKKPSHISADGLTQVIVVHTAFRATDVERDKKLMRALEGISNQTRWTYPGIQVGYAGGTPVTLAEHGALTRGIFLSSIITLLLVSIVLWLHLRSLRLITLLALNILVATILAFGAAALTVGHLNAATAFLGAIIAGNGINYGILLVARYLEERKNAEVEPALATAITGTLLPTLVASLGAAIAYGALGATEFRGFAEFALIGGVGMLVCWITSFVLLPVLVMKFARGLERPPAPLFGRIVVSIFGFRRPVLVTAIAGLVTLGACVISWHYLTHDPYEYDMTQLRSESKEALEARRWLAVSDDNFGRGLAGLAGQTYVAVDEPSQVGPTVQKLEALRQKNPIVGPHSSILDIVPQDQDTKLALLAEIREQIDLVADDLPDDQRADLLALRPADDLKAITVADLPPELAAKITERDGRTGLMIAVKPGSTFDERNGRDLIRFAGAIRSMDGKGVTASGASLLFADVLVQIQKDGPLVTTIAAIGLIIMVLLVVGRSRRAVAVLVASASGSIAMIAVCALMGLKINFLDFVALPITLGLGIDYAINVADRATRSDPRVALRTTGGSVLVCSLTTVIGYLSLFASENLAIRGFGLASLIGEVTCMIAAFVVVPALVALPSRVSVRASGAENLLAGSSGAGGSGVVARASARAR
ncbi:MAG TPA: MMPL family transporter [Kofleriaceae bacterium]|nr:MMPL family transporter [Kofleriaceae bacterium]